MALFTDTDIVTLNDLLTYETGLVQVASTHGINVETKITLALSCISDRVMLWLLSSGGSDPQWLTRRSLGLSTVVVTSPLQRWICFDSLSRFYSEAFNVQLNTRFQGKWTEYKDLAGEAADMAFMSGIGIVYTPLPKPAMPLVSVQAGSAPAQSMFVQTAWVDSLGNEGTLSPVNGLILSGSTTIAVAMAEGESGAPKTAAGWNVYASATEDNLTLQNLSCLPIGAAWQLPASGPIDGTPPQGGQEPSYYVPLSRRIQRG